jgi:hypothetical protein
MRGRSGSVAAAEVANARATAKASDLICIVKNLESYASVV